jgi:hypothetical protein
LGGSPERVEDGGYFSRACVALHAGLAFYLPITVFFSSEF